MSGDFLGSMLSRIDQRQRALSPPDEDKQSDRATSLAAGMSADYIRSIRRQHQTGTQEGVTTTALVALANALRTSPAWLMFGIGPEEQCKPEDRFELCLTWTIFPAVGGAF